MAVLNGKRTRDARSSGEFSKLPDEGAYARARTRTLPHRAHLATVFGPAARKANDPPARVTPSPHPRQGGLREAGASFGVRLRLQEDRRRVLLGYHA
jgi:hypothetical protein